MDYTQKPRFHYTAAGWQNDPNGLVEFGGYYHAFYQHAPHHEKPGLEPMCWGHARTRDFLSWEELPEALEPEYPYEATGCWSGTAIEYDGKLYLYYASCRRVGDNEYVQSISVAYSSDGVHFEKYARNPILPEDPPEGSVNYRDPAVFMFDGRLCCVIASSDKACTVGRLLLYEAKTPFEFVYRGVLYEEPDCASAECPSVMTDKDGNLLVTASFLGSKRHYFSVMYGPFQNGTFTPVLTGEVDKGPDLYAGQAFTDKQGRHILISWIPGWKYVGYAEKDVGCLSAPRELTVRNGKIFAFPVRELQPYLTDSDPALERTQTGVRIARTGREPVEWNGEIRELKILRDGYVIEVFLNGGEEVLTALL